MACIVLHEPVLYRCIVVFYISFFIALHIISIVPSLVYLRLVNWNSPSYIYYSLIMICLCHAVVKYSSMSQENFQNRKYENVQKNTWTLPQIWRGSRICDSFVLQMNIYWTTDWNDQTGSRKKKTHY
jgi:hypothetical protein